MNGTTLRLARLAGGLLAGFLVLTGCSGGAGSSSSDSVDGASSATSPTQAAEFNDADIAFVQGMIPHHEGALMMAEVAVDRATDPRVVGLAERIKAGQGPEIELMTGWLDDWGQQLQAPSGDMKGGAHGSGDMGGMDIEAMPDAGPEFDRMWLEAMIDHHRGAVQMAQTESQNGRNTEALNLAQLITETQNAEIAEMQQLLTELGS